MPKGLNLEMIEQKLKDVSRFRHLRKQNVEVANIENFTKATNEAKIEKPQVTGRTMNDSLQQGIFIDSVNQKLKSRVDEIEATSRKSNISAFL